MAESELLHQSYEVQGGDFERGGEVSTKIKSLLKELGIDPGVVRRIAIATFEAEMNVVMYAERGTITLVLTPEFIQITIKDQGQGIEDIDLAMQEGYSTATPEMREMGFGAGMGLPNIKKNSDEFEIESERNVGTIITITIATNSS